MTLSIQEHHPADFTKTPDYSRDGAVGQHKPEALCWNLKLCRRALNSVPVKIGVTQTTFE